MENRPDKSDFAVAREYAATTIAGLKVKTR